MVVLPESIEFHAMKFTLLGHIGKDLLLDAGWSQLKLELSYVNISQDWLSHILAF